MRLAHTAALLAAASLLLSACGSDDDKPSYRARDYEGVWRTNCYYEQVSKLYTRQTYTITAETDWRDRIRMRHEEYHTRDCSGEPDLILNVEGIDSEYYVREGNTITSALGDFVIEFSDRGRLEGQTVDYVEITWPPYAKDPASGLPTRYHYERQVMYIHNDKIRFGDPFSADYSGYPTRLEYDDPSLVWYRVQ